MHVDGEAITQTRARIGQIRLDTIIAGGIHKFHIEGEGWRNNRNWRQISRNWYEPICDILTESIQSN